MDSSESRLHAQPAAEVRMEGWRVSMALPSHLHPAGLAATRSTGGCRGPHPLLWPDECDGCGAMTRRPRRVYDQGQETDPRFSLANERTLLAWLRSSLALVVAGIALLTLAELTQVDWLPESAAAVAFAGGAATAILAYRQWVRVELALRLSRPLPSNLGSLVFLGSILVLTFIGALAVLTSST